MRLLFAVGFDKDEASDKQLLVQENKMQDLWGTNRKKLITS